MVRLAFRIDLVIISWPSPIFASERLHVKKLLQQDEERAGPLPNTDHPRALWRVDSWLSCFSFLSIVPRISCGKRNTRAQFPRVSVLGQLLLAPPWAPIVSSLSLSCRIVLSQESVPLSSGCRGCLVTNVAVVTTASTISPFAQAGQQSASCGLAVPSAQASTGAAVSLRLGVCPHHAPWVLGESGSLCLEDGWPCLQGLTWRLFHNMTAAEST